MDIPDEAYNTWLILKRKHDKLCEEHTIAGEAFDFEEARRLFDEAQIVATEMDKTFKLIGTSKGK